MIKFIGRTKELKDLEDIASLPQSKLVVIKGRRRIGKSKLAEEFAKNKRFLRFSGIAPSPKTIAQSQRDIFAQQFCEQLRLVPLYFKDWVNAFDHLSTHISNEPTVILLDEISWMGDKDDQFVSKLKDWWDKSLQSKPHLTLILCGSVSTWIEENIINSTALFGRISLCITLRELTLQESFSFLRNMGFKGSTYEVFKILSIFGGIPWYLEQIRPNETADENIKRLCFDENGPLFNEFDRIFNDLFNKRSPIYRKILFSLGYYKKSRTELMDELDYPSSGRFTDHVNDLITSGFISKHGKWNIKEEKEGRQSLYRISDNYIRFYIKHIFPRFKQFSSKIINSFDLSRLPGWDSIIGLQVENLLLNNREILIHSLSISPEDIIAEGPYVQKPNADLDGCQIDYMIQTAYKNLYIFEFKFNRGEIEKTIISKMKNKISKLKTPRGIGICPILVHFGDIAPSVYEENYFYKTLNMQDFLYEAAEEYP